VANADDSALISADQRYLSLEPHGARGVPWRSRMTPDDIKIRHLVTFAVAAERLARKADVGLEAARSWLFEHCRRWSFVLLEVPPGCILPRLSAPSAFPFWEGVEGIGRSRLQVLCDEVEAAIPYLREEMDGPGLPPAPVRTASELMPKIKTKPTIPEQELLVELRRRGSEGDLTSSWNYDSSQLSVWCAEAHPTKPHGHQAIRNNPVLKAEHGKLAPKP
jgi:hypothetical protein